MQIVSSIDRNIECLDGADVTMLQLSGVIDVRLANELIQAAKHCVERKLSAHVDSGRVTSIDTAALQILVALRNACVASEWPFTIDSSSTEFNEIVAMTGLSEALGLASSCQNHRALLNVS